MTCNHLIKAMLFSAALMCLGNAHAQVIDPLIEGAKLCTRNISRYERQYGVPTHLLSAISATESGRYHAGLKIALPWPWTINAEGKGYYFDSKQEAITAVHRLQARGVQSIDVGCMQINLVHHAQAFASLEDAFNPEINVAYGASFLRSLFEQERSWKKAAADYHSKTPSLGKEYVSQVYDRWFNIIDRLRAAHAPVAEATMAALRDTDAQAKPQLLAKATPITPHIISVAPKITPLPEQEGRKVAAFHPSHMNSIQVSGQGNARDHGVLIIRPSIRVVEEAPVQVASVSLSDTLTLTRTIPVNEVVQAHVIHVDNTQLISDAAPKKSGPSFIFDN